MCLPTCLFPREGRCHSERSGAGEAARLWQRSWWQHLPTFKLYVRHSMRSACNKQHAVQRGLLLLAASCSAMLVLPIH